MSTKPTSKFFEAQKPPQLPMESLDNLEWYDEQLLRCENGFEFRGTRFTGDQYWFYNFNPFLVSVLDVNGKPTEKFRTNFPFWSQEDDYLFKQIEEAKQDGKAIFLFTGRSYGKTYIVESVGNNGFFNTNEFHGIISASQDDHAAETWDKFIKGISATNLAHPTIALNLIHNNDSIVEAGSINYINNRKEEIVDAKMEKKLYDKKPGKTKGRRIDFQHFEEVGDWGGSATLAECISASEGTWKVGSIMRARVFYTGTGGTVLSDQAKKIFYNPDSFNIYPVKNWNERGTGIFIPAYKKYGGFWEQTGISDEVGARAHMDAIREQKRKDSDPLPYNKFIQEYPYTPEECFMKRGGNRFPQKKINFQIDKYEQFPENRLGERGNLHWKRKDSKIVGVEWDPHHDGDIWILEHPRLDDDGKVHKNLYIGGYDGIDVGKMEAVTDTGSEGSLCIKKRMLSSRDTSDLYVCFYHARPNDVNDFFDNAFKVMYYFDAITNIEDSKRGIVGFLKARKATRYLMKRPRLVLSNPDSDKVSNMIGTPPVDKNFEYGENFLIEHLKEKCEELHYLPALHDLRDFTMDTRGDHDITVSMMMCELGDDEFRDIAVTRPKPNYEVQNIGFYTDSKGIKHYGKIPKGKVDQFNFKSNSSFGLTRMANQNFDQ